MDDTSTQPESVQQEKVRRGFSMPMLIAVVILALVIAFPAGFIVGRDQAGSAPEDATIDVTQAVDDHAQDDDTAADADMTAMQHSHIAYDVPEGTDAPKITMLEVVKDAKSGWNLHLATENFLFTPENASGTHVEGEGHAHLYIDDVKITRLYGDHYYIGELEEGEHTVHVTLNTNDHKDYAVNGAVVEASKTITVEPASTSATDASDANTTHTVESDASAVDRTQMSQ